MERLAFIPVIFLLLTLLAGCGDDDETAPMINEVAYTAADYHFIGPQFLPSGMTKLTLARQGKRMLQGFGSMYKVMLLDDEDQEDEEDRYGAPPGQGRGGFQAIKSGGGGVFTTDFTPGNYAVVCFVEDPTPARLILPWE